MEIDVKKINEKIVLEINMILEYSKHQEKANNVQDFLQARMYREKKALQFKSLLKDLVDIRNLYSPEKDQISPESFLSALGSIINLSKKPSPWD